MFEYKPPKNIPFGTHGIKAGMVLKDPAGGEFHVLSANAEYLRGKHVHRNKEYHFKTIKHWEVISDPRGAEND